MKLTKMYYHFGKVNLLGVQYGIIMDNGGFLEYLFYDDYPYYALY